MLLNSSELFGTPRYLVMDPVHGGIAYFSHEKQIMNHPLFQRLRHIKQNDILHFVFPGATHSRFEHSLGTMHIAGRIFKHVIRNYLTSRNQLELSTEQIDAIQYCYGCLRIAALLHDCGHMPFSHLFEESEAGKTILSNKDTIENLFSGDKSELIDSSVSQLHHEHYSILCAHTILNEVEPSVFIFEPLDVLGMMENGSPPPSERFCTSAISIVKLFTTKEVSFDAKKMGNVLRGLFKDIISGEIDADKMDYLLRDSYFSGCNYGAYNIDHLAQNICVGYDLNLDDAWIGIALNRKGLGALEDFVQSRFKMYVQVYGHKTVVGLKWLVRKAIAEILANETHEAHIRESLCDLHSFVNFTDTYCWEAFRSQAKKNASSACSDLVARNKLIHIKQIDDQVEFEKRNVLSTIQDKFGVPVIQDECSSRFSKINPSFQKMRLLMKDEVTGKYRLEAITKHSSFFGKFQDVIVTHYYKAPKWYNVQGEPRAAIDAAGRRE